MTKIKLQFVGTFIYYKEIELNSMEQNYFDSIAKGIGLSLNEALIDPFFYYKLRLNKYQSYLDLNGKSYFGLDVQSFHQIEVFVDGHKKQKFTYLDLNPENVLFPLYSSKIIHRNLKNNLTIIKKKEKGTISYSIINETSKELNELISFNLLFLKNDLFISDFLFNNEEINTSKTDTLITEQYVILEDI